MKSDMVKILAACMTFSAWCVCHGGHGSRPDVLFILVDSLKASHVGCYGYERNTTPNIAESSF